jgi:NADP-dependent 3-hydroxy acid dehydrogenase YdfG
MDGALAAALGVIGSAAVTGAVAMYGSKVAGRAQREGNAVTGFSSLTNELQEERKELKAEVAALKLELATERAESARLRLLLQAQGGTP